MNRSKMKVTRPRRILAVSLTDSAPHLIRVMKDLTGSLPDYQLAELAGTSHILPLDTHYYTAEVPIWLDLISEPIEWAASFLSPDAKEVLRVLGGVMVVFALPVNPDSEEGKASRDLISKVGEVVKSGLGGWTWDGVGLCLGIGEIDDVDVWDDCASAAGLEFVQVRKQSTSARNEFGEKTGIPRALEALEANEWDDATFDEPLPEPMPIPEDVTEPLVKLGHGSDPEDFDSGFDGADFEELKRAIWSAAKADGEGFIDGQQEGQDAKEIEDMDISDEEVRKMERMFAKLKAVRDSSDGLPEDQRKRAAAKAVAEVMRYL
ncbi:hypothetical protein F4859DRAFT_492493 [Xylaria cf. heliscus]|nr:hypothetical protein F4859DRAFT_492493 [Xylaria cf. heliscus]